MLAPVIEFVEATNDIPRPLVLSTILDRVAVVDSAGDADYAPPTAVRLLPSWLLGQAARRAHELVTSALSDEGPGRQHYTVLASLAEHGPASQADLGRRLSLDRSDAHAIVSALEQSSLIRRTADPEDHRRKVVKITSNGKRTLTQLQQKIQSAQDQILAPLDKREREQLIALLARIGRS
jgi:MarR family transcriptional regulator, lower aerobic nicotinate degradation pathway regulator